jgi:hypothetical protein
VTALTDIAAERTLAWLTGQATTAPATPLMVRLLTAIGDDVAAGTQVSGSGNGYTPQQFTPGTVVTTAGVTQVKNTNLIRFNNMPGVVVVGFEIWDSAGTPFRWMWALLQTPRTFDAGDPAEFAVGELVVTAD